jgi:hypothetical protein
MAARSVVVGRGNAAIQAVCPISCTRVTISLSSAASLSSLTSLTAVPAAAESAPSYSLAGKRDTVPENTSRSYATLHACSPGAIT